jgi:NAD-dependent dihydropyrimidine dehydrogenase PreA subunit
MAFRVIVESEKCKSCEECLEVCTINVFEVKEGKSVAVREQECLGCKSCSDVCKESAITIEELHPEMSEVARMLLRDIL